MAGKGGMNITHAEPLADFKARYGGRQAEIAALLDRFGPQDLRDWIHGLGVDTFVGTSGRVFPTEMKAAPLLRAWLHRLRGQGVQFRVRHRWLGWTADGALRFATPDGEIALAADATVLALGAAAGRSSVRTAPGCRCSRPAGVARRAAAAGQLRLRRRGGPRISANATPASRSSRSPPLR
jgi:predicted flavoprotein YhiN